MNNTNTARFANTVIDFGYGARLDLGALRTAVEAKDWKAVIELTGIGCGHIDVRSIWALAMTARYGVGHVHESYLDAEGCPTAAALAKFPRMAERMREAGESIDAYHLWRLEANGRS